MELAKTGDTRAVGSAQGQDPRSNERFHLYPDERLRVIAAGGSIVGALSGFYDGVRIASLRYLAENGHRLPRTVGAWYFYHKKKNYVMIINGAKTAVRQAIKFSVPLTFCFGLEALIDEHVRHSTKDLFSTTAALMVTFGLYGAYNKLSRVQTLNYIRKGSLLGLSVGFSQDMLIWIRGGKIWYLEKLGIENPMNTKREETLFAA